MTFYKQLDYLSQFVNEIRVWPGLLEQRSIYLPLPFTAAKGKSPAEPIWWFLENT